MRRRVLAVTILGSLVAVSVAACTRAPSAGARVTAASSPSEILREERAARHERKAGCERQAQGYNLSPYQRCSFVWKCMNG
jgi:hypothetical protein